MSSQLPLSCWLAVTQDPHKDQEAQTQLCSDSLFLETWLCQGDGHLLWPSSLTAPLQRKTQPALNLIFIHFTRNWCDEEFNVRLLKTLYLALENISLLFFFFQFLAHDCALTTTDGSVLSPPWCQQLAFFIHSLELLNLAGKKWQAF